ncbi:MAG: hypothetical protein AB7L13_01540 [Acidimicrobiia bacterium]
MPVDRRRRLSLARLLDPEVEFVVVTELADGSLLVTPSAVPDGASG